MARTTARREEWRYAKGMWTRSLQAEGIHVRLFQKRKHGKYYRDVRRPGLPKDRKCIGTYDQKTAVHIGRELLAGLLRNQELESASDGTLLLGSLLARYSAESPTFSDNSESTKADATARSAILTAHFGKDCDVRFLTENDIKAYAARRRAGGIKYAVKGKTKESPAVRARSVERDLNLLCAALKWATTVRVNGGKRLLDHHPLAGFRRQREKNPKRPIATWERFQKMREAAKQLAMKAEAVSADPQATPAARQRGMADYTKWTRVELAIVLFEATGRRRGSIRQVWWEDMSLPAAGEGEIRWRAEADKKRQEWITPIPIKLVEELRAFRRKLGAVKGLVFPSTRNAAASIRGDVLSSWIGALEKKANLPKLDGGLCHPFRRKWATERKHLPVKDVAAVGGWKDVGTLLVAYQQADRATMLAVMQEPTKVTEAVALGA